MAHILKGIVVARSRKNHGFCVVVFDIEKKNFYRLVSENDDRIDRELSKEECCYDDGTLIELKDIIEIRVKSFERVRDLVQSENIFIEPNARFKLIKKKIPYKEMMNYIENNLCKDINIFNNTSPTLTPVEAKYQKKSFVIVQVTNLSFYKVYNEEKQDYKFYCDFRYNNNYYHNMRVTISESKEEDIMKYDEKTYLKATLGISFGHVYQKTNLHYKFVCAFLGGFK